MYFTQICLALRRIHRANLIHRNTKCTNIFLHNNGSVTIALLGDFGITRQLSTLIKFSETFSGTPEFLSPEQINGMDYDQNIDIFNAGDVLYQMCALIPPFDGPTYKEVEHAVLN